MNLRACESRDNSKAPIGAFLLTPLALFIYILFIVLTVKI